MYRELLLQTSAHPKIDYTAREEEAPGALALRKHYVGVYDPETGKLELLAARKMVVRGVVRSHQNTAADEAESLQKRTTQDYREAQKELGSAFGTKKAKKALVSLTENAIGPARSYGDKPAKMDSGAAAIIASMEEATAGMATRDELAEAAEAAKPRPKANLDAEEIKDVYTIDNLIGEDIFKSIPVLEWQTAVKAQKAIRVNSKWVASRITKVAASTEKLKCLRYMLLLVDLYNSLQFIRGGKKLPKKEDMRKLAGNMPESILEGMRRKFADGATMSKFQVDLLITHICALACLVDNFEVDMWDLRLDMKMEIKQMQLYFHEIGARIVAFPEARRAALGIDKAMAAQRKLARLKLPLDFPKVSFGKRLK